MRYMFLIYSRETAQSETSTGATRLRAAHWAIVEEARRRGVFEAAAPLQPTATATTVRIEAGRPLVTDGPLAQTEEQLAGYCILDCRDLDEAIGWAAKIPTACKGGEGCVEIRPVAALPSP